MGLRRKRRVVAPVVPVAVHPLLCRWDLDKTYLRSEFDTLRTLVRTAFERAEDKVEIPGVAEVIKAIKAAAARRRRTALVYFISASPPQIGKAIRAKLALDGVPYDGIVFKDQLQNIRRGRLRNLREHVGFKLVELLRGRLAAPGDARELLFGDDWESDSLIYSLYADILAGALDIAQLAPIVQRIRVDTELVAEIGVLAGRARGRGGVERIFINLERRTPPAIFRRFGARVVPTFNYFQTAAVLAGDGQIDPEDVVRVAEALIARAGYTDRGLENSLADVVRRGHVASPVAETLCGALRAAGLLPPTTRATSRWRALAASLGRFRRPRHPAPVVPPAPVAAKPLDYDAILNRLRPETRPLPAAAGATSRREES